MRLDSALRYAVACAVLLTTTALALASAPRAEGQSSFLQDGQAGFVVSDISYALADDASVSGACPNGMTTNAALQAEVDAQLAQADAGISQAERQRRIADYFTANEATNPCMHPEVRSPDPNFRTVEGTNLTVDGIDMDGQNSRANGTVAPSMCAHDDFRGRDGARGIDNQFYRVVGCSPSFQSTGQSNSWRTEMLTGAWGILITLKGVDDIRNDDSVEVGFYANADPIELSPNREPLWNASYAMSQDPRFRAIARGRIVNGVLTTDPADVRFWKITNALWLERVLNAARVRMTLSADGVLDGYLAGYTPVEAMYDLQFGMRDATDRSGNLAPLLRRTVTSMGAARVLGYTCNGVYHALLAAADGDRDPATGRCTSISTQYHIRAIPAFVMDVPTESLNEDLGRTESQRDY